MPSPPPNILAYAFLSSPSDADVDAIGTVYYVDIHRSSCLLLVTYNQVDSAADHVRMLWSSTFSPNVDI